MNTFAFGTSKSNRSLHVVLVLIYWEDQYQKLVVLKNEKHGKTLKHAMKHAIKHALK